MRSIRVRSIYKQHSGNCIRALFTTVPVWTYNHRNKERSEKDVAFVWENESMGALTVPDAEKSGRATAIFMKASSFFMSPFGRMSAFTSGSGDSPKSARKDAHTGAAPDNGAGKGKSPPRLKLEFSKASDYGRINAMFDPAVKGKIDPQRYVVTRADGELKKAITSGGCAFLGDTKTGEVQTMAVAYEVRDGNIKHAYTELGTTLSRMSGYGSAQLVVAALALREWWENPPQNMIVTEIRPDNKPSVKTYAMHLGWRQVSNPKTVADLHRLCNETVSPQDRDDSGLWFHCDDSVITHQARILLSFMDQGGVLQRQTRKKVDVDFSALDDIGLTRKRLTAIALGTTDRKKLAALAP